MNGEHFAAFFEFKRENKFKDYGKTKNMLLLSFVGASSLVSRVGRDIYSPSKYDLYSHSQMNLLYLRMIVFSCA
jgi:hypothetical protein